MGVYAKGRWFFLAGEYFYERERALLGSRFDQLLTPAAGQAARGVTVNTLRCTAQRFAAGCGLPLRPSPFCPVSYFVDMPDFHPGRHPYHHAGAFYSQEPSAAAPAALLDVQPGMKVLDTCAAPGGKSSQLAAALQGQGLLVCNEYEAGRASILRGNLERMGVSNGVVTNEDTARLAEAFPAFFDRVLVDAPCSGEGMFRKEPQALTQHSEALVRQCAALGAQILENAARMLAPGGLLVYSTCTFAPEEDEGQVAAFLARHPEFVLESCGEAFGSPGEENRTGGLPLDVSKVRRIWPSQGGEGHFMARLRRLDGPEAVPVRPAKSAPICKEWSVFAKEYFPELAGRPAVLRGDKLFLTPAVPMPAAAQKLRILRAGVLAGTVRKGRFEPEHHLFTSFGTLCKNQLNLPLADGRVQAYLQGHPIPAPEAGNGWCAVLVDGYSLGGAKVSGGTAKNHYPKGLRLLGPVEIGPGL